MVLVKKTKKYLPFASMHLQLKSLLILSINIAATLAIIPHDLITDKLEGRQVEQLSLYKSISTNDYLADSPLLILAFKTKELRDNNKAPQHAAEKGYLFGAMSATDQWTIYTTKYDPQQHFTSQADHILELQLIAAAMEKAHVTSVNAFEKSQWEKIIDLANAVDNMAYIETYLNHHKAAVIKHAMGSIYDQGSQNSLFNPNAGYSPNTKNINHELIIYLHSMCQAMLNTAAEIDKVAATPQQNQFKHTLNLHAQVASLLHFMTIPIESAGENIWKCNPPAIVTLFNTQ
ncbi:hypothetical protein HYPSUDRAFT_58551 [Hypholoma sublateritium FD-334 SS-4]|uniref:Uncharacterized protein n=1 Tax=Hypholoma sublateritium (strain FD-334 SS-4) TaxID=945553 RepID=A0A0D2NGV0_HYPSF|nr:hypothetical protein HYPSUDRAFT_58551 [Hypholoma sublateritium FD-334 SS-4]